MRSDLDYTQSRCARGSFVFFAIKHDNIAMMLAFFPNGLDLPDRVTANLLVGFLLGAAMTTSRVGTLGAVSTTLPLSTG
jgi:hypothetical protein